MTKTNDAGRRRDTNGQPCTDAPSAAVPIVTAIPEPSGFSPSAPAFPDAPAAAAVPITHFEYDAVASHDTTQKSRDFTSTDQDIPTAPFLPGYEDACGSRSKSGIERDRVKLGNVMGKIAAEEERVVVNKGKRDGNAKDYYAREAVRAGNKEAKVRDEEGLEVKDDNWYKVVESKEKKEDSDITTYAKTGGGYEVSAYEVSEYEGREYNVDYEYKSVYDE